jgi:hypothetical protein
MLIQKYKNQICPVDTSFLKVDEFTFSVLIRILKGVCSLTITDGARIVICYSTSPFPVWIWTPDDASEEEMEQAYLLAREHFDLRLSRFNLKYRLSDYFIARAGEDGISLGIDTNMLAYSCPTPILPKKSVPGFLEVAGDEDVLFTAQFLKAFHEALNADRESDKGYLEMAKNYISQKQFFYWNDGNERVACCNYIRSGNKCNIGNVYTLPTHRCKGYAANIIYAVSKRIAESGCLPTLYTDADYIASNTCYAQVGFITLGKLCTLGRTK